MYMEIKAKKKTERATHHSWETNCQNTDKSYQGKIFTRTKSSLEDSNPQYGRGKSSPEDLNPQFPPTIRYVQFGGAMQKYILE